MQRRRNYKVCFDKSVVSADFLTHADSSPAVNVKCELLNGVGGRGVSHWSRAALHRSSASGSRQVKHNKPRLSQAWGIIYLDPAPSARLYFSNTLHFRAPVAALTSPTVGPNRPHITCFSSGWRRGRARKKYLTVGSHFWPVCAQTQFIRLHFSRNQKRRGLKETQRRWARTRGTFVCRLQVKGFIIPLL